MFPVRRIVSISPNGKEKILDDEYYGKSFLKRIICGLIVRNAYDSALEYLPLYGLEEISRHAFYITPIRKNLICVVHDY
jgi:hypothetical protein